MVTLLLQQYQISVNGNKECSKRGVKSAFGNDEEQKKFNIRQRTTCRKVLFWKNSSTTRQKLCPCKHDVTKSTRQKLKKCVESWSKRIIELLRTRSGTPQQMLVYVLSPQQIIFIIKIAEFTSKQVTLPPFTKELLLE